jgi:GTP-binding protein EngB required for normal cell division
VTPAEARATREGEPPAVAGGPAGACPGAASDALRSKPLLALDLLQARVFDEDERTRIETVRARVAEACLYIVAVGEFKRGKSTLLNALIGRRLLPVGVVPLTAVVTLLRRGTEGATALREDGSTVEIDPARLADYVTEAGNPGNRRGLARVEVRLPDLDLPPHTVLVDTPGLGSVYESGTAHTLDFLPQVDVALVVLAVDQPFAEAEERLAVDLREQGAELLFALNKADHLDEDGVREALAFVSERLVGAGLSEAPVFAVSAKTALDDRFAGGMDDLRSGLHALLDERYEALQASHSERRVRTLLDELETERLVLAEVAGRGERELGVALEQLTASRSDIARLADEQSAVFDHRVRAIERSLGERTVAFRRELEDSLLQAVSSVLDGTGPRDENAVDEALAAAIDAALRARVTTEGARLQQELHTAVHRLFEAFDSLAASLTRDTERILGVAVARPQPLAAETTVPSVDVKLRDDPVGLEMLTGALQAPVPGRLRRRLLARRSRERAGELADRHAGRMRSRLADSLRDAARDVRREARGQLEHVAGSIDAAVRRGLAQRRLARGEAESARRETAAALAAVRSARDILDGTP